MGRVNYIQQFQEDCRVRGLAKDTCESYPAYVQALAKFVQPKTLLEANKNDLKSYLSYLRLERKLRQTSIERMFSAIATYYDYLIEEDLVPTNPVRSVQKRYLRAYKDSDESQMRRIISVEDAAKIVNSVLDTRDRAVVLLLLKTGIRCSELTSLDLENLDLNEQTIRLKPTAKRSNRIIYFDHEAAIALSRWIMVRQNRNIKNCSALFLNREGTRLHRSGVHRLVTKIAENVGLHNPSSSRMEEHFSPHNCRHWFTTHLIRSGMSRDFVKELRGDIRHEAIDIYNHIDKKELRESYLAHIPQLGI
jgi:Site-specific recombinase XerD